MIPSPLSPSLSVFFITRFYVRLRIQGGTSTFLPRRRSCQCVPLIVKWRIPEDDGWASDESNGPKGESRNTSLGSLVRTLIETSSHFINENLSQRGEKASFRVVKLDIEQARARARRQKACYRGTLFRPATQQRGGLSEVAPLSLHSPSQGWKTFDWSQTL